MINETSKYKTNRSKIREGSISIILRSANVAASIHTKEVIWSGISYNTVIQAIYTLLTYLNRHYSTVYISVSTSYILPFKELGLTISAQ